MNSLTASLNKLRFVEMSWALARWFLARTFKPGRAYRIPFGPIAGQRLYYQPAVNFHMMLGLWESRSYAFLRKVLARTGIPQGFTVADLGANLGYFSLWMDKLAAQNAGRVYAFEPSPSILPLLRQNLAANQTRHTEIVEQACADQVGQISFFVGDHHHVSSLDATWAGRQNEISVAATTLDAFFEGRNYPDFIKVDIEGGGVFALKGMDACLTRKRPLLWIESHTPNEDRAISDLMLKHGYQAYRLQTQSVVTDRAAIHPSPNGVWGTMLLFPQELPLFK